MHHDIHIRWCYKHLSVVYVLRTCWYGIDTGRDLSSYLVVFGGLGDARRSYTEVLFGIPGAKSSYFVMCFGLGDANMSYFNECVGIAGVRSSYFVVLFGFRDAKSSYLVVFFAIPGVKSSSFVVLFGFGDVKRLHLVVFFGIAGARIYLVISILDGYNRIEVESVTKYISKKTSYIFRDLHFGRL